MAIATMCMGCGKSLNIPEICLGKKMQCRYCGVIFLMPLPMAGCPSFLMQWKDFSSRGVSSAAAILQPSKISLLPSICGRRSGNFTVPLQGEVGLETGRFPMVVSETGVYEPVKRAGEETAFLPRIEKSRSGSFRPVDPKSDRYAMSRFGSSGSSRAAALHRTARHRSISDKTHLCQPIGMPALSSRRVKSSAELSVLPQGGRNPDFNLIQIGSIAAVLFVGVLSFVFFFGPHSDSIAKKPGAKLAQVEASIIPVALKVHEADVIERVPARQISATSALQKNVVKPAPKLAASVPIVAAPAITMQEPEVEVIEILMPTVTHAPVPPAAGAFESLNQAIGELPAHANAPTKAEQAEMFSAAQRHDQAAKLYEQAAEEAEKAGHQEEAQLFSLKSIEERRMLDEKGSRTPFSNRK